MELFLTIAITHFMALLTPGVDFLLILKTVMHGESRRAYYVCFGIASGNAVILFCIYLCMFLLGKFSTDFLFYFKFIGALYLIYLAGQCFLAARKNLQFVHEFAVIDDHVKVDSVFKSYLIGLGSSLLNPKNILFYSTLVVLIYTQFNFLQNLLICIWVVSVVLLWNVGIVRLLSRKFYKNWLQHHVKKLYVVSGICFTVFALVLVI